MDERQAKTIKHMPPYTRRLAHALNALQRSIDRVDALLPMFQNFELDSNAFWTMKNKQISGRDNTSEKKSPYAYVA